MTDRTTADAVHTIYVEQQPLTVSLDIEGHIRATLHDALELLTGELYPDLVEIAEAEPRPYDGHAPERPLFEELLNRVAEAVATKVVMTPQQAHRVGGQMRDAAAGPMRSAA
jgi:hypothetical protein